MTAETVVAEPPTITRADLRELETNLRREVQQDIQESEDRLHRELQHYATKADLKDTELRLGTEISGLRTDLKDTELRLRTEIGNVELRLQAQIKEAQMWLLLRLGGLIVAVATIAVAVLKLLEGVG